MIDTAKAFRTVKSAFEKVDSELRLYHYKIRNYREKIHFRFERGDFTVKTATTGAELEECLRLRFEVFHREYMLKKRASGVDVDWLDFNCDHLMIVDNRSKRTIGTYRLNSSLFSKMFYSEGEFEIQELLKMPGTKLELGRACIAKDFRNGSVITLLWRGIAEYIRLTNTKILFGCSSIKTMEPMEIGKITRHLETTGALTYDYSVRPTKKFRLKHLGLVMDYLRDQPASEAVEIPALFESYLKMGAKICGEPALDREFHCIDFLTLIKTDEIHPAIRTRYGIGV